MKKMKTFKTMISVLVVALMMTTMASIALADGIKYKVAGVSSENKDYLGVNLESDGPEFWHTQWEPQAPSPHWVVLDLGALYSVNELKYLPRQDNTNSHGHVTDYNVYVSNDNKEFKKIASGTWALEDNKIEEDATFAPTEARYVKLESVHDTNMAAQRITILGTKVAGAAANTQVATDAKAAADTQATPANPKTGDTGVQFYIVIALLSAIVLVASKKIRFNN